MEWFTRGGDPLFKLEYLLAVDLGVPGERMAVAWAEEVRQMGWSRSSPSVANGRADKLICTKVNGGVQVQGRQIR